MNFMHLKLSLQIYVKAVISISGESIAIIRYDHSHYIKVRESYSRRDKDNLGRLLEGYSCYTYGICTIALDDSRNRVSRLYE